MVTLVTFCVSSGVHPRRRWAEPQEWVTRGGACHWGPRSCQNRVSLLWLFRGRLSASPTGEASEALRGGLGLGPEPWTRLLDTEAAAQLQVEGTEGHLNLVVTHLRSFPRTVCLSSMALVRFRLWRHEGEKQRTVTAAYFTGVCVLRPCPWAPPRAALSWPCRAALFYSLQGSGRVLKSDLTAALESPSFQRL